MAIFSFTRIVFMALSIAVLSSCSIHPSSDIGGRINTVVQTASGIVQDAKNTTKDIEQRAKTAQKGIQELASGATLLQNSVKP